MTSVLLSEINAAAGIINLFVSLSIASYSIPSAFQGALAAAFETKTEAFVCVDMAIPER